MEMPRPHGEHQKLHRLAGRWAGEEKLSPSPWGPGGTATGRFDSRIALDGFFVLMDYEEEKDGRITFRGHSVHGWDDQRKLVTWYWVDSMGMPPAQAASGGWEGDQLVLHQQSPMGEARYSWRFLGPDRFQFRIENNLGGKGWQTFMEGDYRRVG